MEYENSQNTTKGLLQKKLVTYQNLKRRILQNDCRPKTSFSIYQALVANSSTPADEKDHSQKISDTTNHEENNSNVSPLTPVTNQGKYDLDSGIILGTEANPVIDHNRSISSANQTTSAANIQGKRTLVVEAHSHLNSQNVHVNEIHSTLNFTSGYQDSGASQRYADLHPLSHTGFGWLPGLANKSHPVILNKGFQIHTGSVATSNEFTSAPHVIEGFSSHEMTNGKDIGYVKSNMPASVLDKRGSNKGEPGVFGMSYISKDDDSLVNSSATATDLNSSVIQRLPATRPDEPSTQGNHILLSRTNISPLVKNSFRDSGIGTSHVAPYENSTSFSEFHARNSCLQEIQNKVSHEHQDGQKRVMQHEAERSNTVQDFQVGNVFPTHSPHPDKRIFFNHRQSENDTDKILNRQSRIWNFINDNQTDIQNKQIDNRFPTISASSKRVASLQQEITMRNKLKYRRLVDDEINRRQKNDRQGINTVSPVGTSENSNFPLCSNSSPSFNDHDAVSTNISNTETSRHIINSSLRSPHASSVLPAHERLTSTPLRMHPVQCVNSRFLSGASISSISTTMDALQPLTDNTKPKRKRMPRTVYTDHQLDILEDSYHKNSYPSKEMVIHLFKTLGVTFRNVKVWFQNRRARDKKKRAKENTGVTVNRLIDQGKKGLSGPSVPDIEILRRVQQEFPNQRYAFLSPANHFK